MILESNQNSGGSNGGVTKTQAISNFLQAKTVKDLADLYTANMECQVNVSQDAGERIEGDFKGRRWHGWTDGMTTWKSFRIPYKASTDPEFVDNKISFDLEIHAESIGMTGWDWKNRCSKWLAYDFDAIIGHSDKHTKKMSNEDLEAVKKEALALDWVTVRRSTSGSGLHLYVFVDDIPTANHNEHAALARAILGMMSALTGYDFNSKVDICGGNMWVWHRKQKNTNGFELIKQGSVLENVPDNWKDHIKVTTGQRRKNLPQNINVYDFSSYDELCGQYPKVQLEDEHKKLIKYFEEQDMLWWWDQDRYMLVTHTLNLKKATDELSLKGCFDTLSTGSNLNEQNCFCFPIRKGAWSVRRFSQGCSEHKSWSQDNAGWTMCYLNREPDLKTACRSSGGIEDTKGGFVFNEAEIAESAAELLGISLNIGTAHRAKKTVLKQHKDGRLIAEVAYSGGESVAGMEDWLVEKNKLIKILSGKVGSVSVAEDTSSYDDFVRHLITTHNEDYGWSIKRDGYWGAEPLTNIRLCFGSMGIPAKEVTSILGSSVIRPWRMVNRPFQPEYPGDREWNRDSAQLKFLPDRNKEDLHFPHWLKILQHCGKGLDSVIKTNAWAKANGVSTGADYLKCWIASLFQNPLEPLPFLFLYSEEQNTGKSIFHEALSSLFTKGYVKANAALESNSNFNKELEGMLLCVLEEVDLGRNKTAYNRIKDWVTGIDILIHEKGVTPYTAPNTTHWIQCANDRDYCPIFPGDTRITMICIDPIDPIEMIPKPHLLSLLEKEAVDFITSVMDLEIPPSNDRLGVPVIDTGDKAITQRGNMNEVQAFIDEKCCYKPGNIITILDFYNSFISWIDPSDVGKWSKIKMGKLLPSKYIKGRMSTGIWGIGNIAMSKDKDNIADGKRLILNDKLSLVEDNDD